MKKLIRNIKCNFGYHLWVEKRTYRYYSESRRNRRNRRRMKFQYLRYCNYCLEIQIAPRYVNDFGEHEWRYERDAEKIKQIDDVTLQRLLKLKKIRAKM